MSGSNSELVDVAVVGAGPVGLALTGLLARQGLSVVLLDRGKHGVNKPRATHLDDETVRIMQAVGVADELEPDFYKPGSFHLYDTDWNMLAYTTLHGDVSDQGWSYDYMFHQPTFETRMREILEATAGVTARFGVDVTAVTQSSGSATVVATDLDAGQGFEVEARYVVGCDGASSVVRESMGAELEDLHGSQRWVVIDIILKDGAEVTDELHTYATTGPERTYTFVPTGDNRRRIEFKALEHETDESLEQEDNVWKLLEKWVTPETATIERADTYQFNALLAKPWREGRLFIAGDAAHQMAPKAGQGMCSGLRDAANLSWKLAFCVNGRASSSLLDTYESERSPHSRIWIQISEAIAKAIDHLSSGGKPEIQGEQKPAGRPPIGPGLHGEAPPPAGLLSIQPILEDGTKLDDRVGAAFAVIATQDLLDAADGSTRTIWDELGAVVLSSTEAGYDGFLKGFGASGVVIRPDKYIFGTTDSAAGLDALTENLRKALGTGTAQAVGAPAGDSQ